MGLDHVKIAAIVSSLHVHCRRDAVRSLTDRLTWLHLRYGLVECGFGVRAWRGCPLDARAHRELHIVGV